MKKSQSGFTLIELVVVIVLLGILGVTALGKFQNLTGEAEDAAIDGVTSELSGSAAINYAASTLGVAGSVALTVADVCAVANTLFASNTVPTGFTITAGAGEGDCTGPVAGEAVDCTVTHTASSKTRTASLICTG